MTLKYQSSSWMPKSKFAYYLFLSLETLSAHNEYGRCPNSCPWYSWTNIVLKRWWRYSITLSTINSPMSNAGLSWTVFLFKISSTKTMMYKATQQWHALKFTEEKWISFEHHKSNHGDPFIDKLRWHPTPCLSTSFYIEHFKMVDQKQCLTKILQKLLPCLQLFVPHL